MMCWLIQAFVVQQVLDVKLRLRQIEMEMSYLRKKQAEMKRDGKSMSSLGKEINTWSNYPKQLGLCFLLRFFPNNN